MAGKKRKTTHHRRRSHRVGAMRKETMDILWLGAGAFVGAITKRFIDTALAKQTTVQLDPKLVSGIEIAAGAVVAYRIPNWFIKGMGIGVAAEGGVTILQSMGVLSGLSLSPEVPFYPRPNMAGLTRTQTVGALNAYGFPQPSSVAGSRMSNATRFAGAY